MMGHSKNFGFSERAHSGLGGQDGQSGQGGQSRQCEQGGEAERVRQHKGGAGGASKGPKLYDTY